MECSLDVSAFLKRSLVIPLSLFPSIIKHCSLKKAFLSLPALFWNPVFNCMYVSLSALFFTSLHSSTICKACSDNHFVLLLFFLFGLGLFATSCTILQTFVHRSSGTLLTRSSPLNLFVYSTHGYYSVKLWMNKYQLLSFPKFLIFWWSFIEVNIKMGQLHMKMGCQGNCVLI